MSVRITYEIALAKLTELVDEKGEEFIYTPSTHPKAPYDGTGCYYRDASGNPSCGVGQVFYKLDPEHNLFKELAEREDYALTDSEDTSFSSMVEDWEDLDIDEDAADLLTDFQQSQDLQVAYGAALESAVRFVLRRRERGMYNV